MQPAQPTQQAPQFNQDHHDVYNSLREVLHGFVQQGIPGMDTVLNALNQAHTKMLTPQQMQASAGKPAVPQPNRQQMIQPGMGQ